MDGRRDAAIKDPERPLVAAPGCGFIASAAADDSERPERWNELWMVWAEAALFDRERAAQACLGPLEMSESCVDRAQVAECHADLVVLRAQCAFEHREGAFE